MEDRDKKSLIRRGSTSISATFLIIASFLIASMVAGTIFYATSLILDSVQKFEKDIDLRSSYKIVYIGGGFNRSDDCIFIILENCGKKPVEALDRIKIVYGGIGTLFKPEYCSGKNFGHWNYIEMGYRNGRWDVGEPLIFRIYNGSSISPPYFVELHLENGLTYTFRFGDKFG